MTFIMTGHCKTTLMIKITKKFQDFVVFVTAHTQKKTYPKIFIVLLIFYFSSIL